MLIKIENFWVRPEEVRAVTQYTPGVAAVHMDNGDTYYTLDMDHTTVAGIINNSLLSKM